MLGPIFESIDWLKAHNPRSIFRKRRLNFITIHCKSTMSVVGSDLYQLMTDRSLLQIFT